MRLASVSPGSKIESLSGVKLPITCVTAIASPSARPRPRMTAATTPPRTDGMTTVLHHLPARRAEPDRALLELGRDADEELAADRRRDRDDHDRQHEHRGEHGRLDLVAAVGEDRDPAEDAPEERLRRAARRTARARRCPRARSTTLGTAASISTSVPTGPRTDGGASSLRKRPIAIETRRREQHRAERRDERADDQVARAELARRPGSTRCARGSRARRP